MMENIELIFTLQNLYSAVPVIVCGYLGYYVGQLQKQSLKIIDEYDPESNTLLKRRV